jgi:hypothetical protein
LSERRSLASSWHGRQQAPRGALTERKHEHQPPPTCNDVRDTLREVGVKLHICEHDFLPIRFTIPPDFG